MDPRGQGSLAGSLPCPSSLARRRALGASTPCRASPPHVAAFAGLASIPKRWAACNPGPGRWAPAPSFACNHALPVGCVSVGAAAQVHGLIGQDEMEGLLDREHTVLRLLQPLLAKGNS